MADIDLELRKAGFFEKIDRKRYHLRIAFDVRIADQLRADLGRLLELALQRRVVHKYIAAVSKTERNFLIPVILGHRTCD